MKLPILLDHDHTKPVGAVELVDGALQMRFDADVKITKDIAFQIFGDLGFQVLEYSQQDGLMLIRKARILEWSLCPAPAAQPLALWQPIETAPKDGTKVLLWAQEKWHEGIFEGGRWCKPEGYPFIEDPTHWAIPAEPPQ
jgi:hypothetical protein